MRSKRLLATLIVALMLLLTGCGFGSHLTSEESEQSSTPKEVQDIVESDPTRFSAEDVDISGIRNASYSCIITDHQTGEQFLYIWNRNGPAGGSCIVKIGNINIKGTTD